MLEMYLNRPHSAIERLTLTEVVSSVETRKAATGEMLGEWSDAWAKLSRQGKGERANH
jgi:hypothetical protein